MALERNGREFDVAIGDIGFRLATSEELPQGVETIPLRKEQFDTEAEPGEQSLTGWWRRSQESFHEGAGNLYQEARGELNASNGFNSSEALDVFHKPGTTRPTRAMNSTEVPVGTGISSIEGVAGNRGGVGVVCITPWTGGVRIYDDILGAPSTFDAYLTTETFNTAVVSGTTIYGAPDSAEFIEGSTATNTISKRWNIDTIPGSVIHRLIWGKFRLWGYGGRGIWQPDFSLATGTSQPHVFENPLLGWSYTCATEGPAAMYFGGYDNETSSIQAIVLNSDGSLPTLSGATTVAVLPRGENVNDIEVIGGHLMGIATTKGFRVGVLDGVNVTYGPLIYEGNVERVGSQGRYFIFSTWTDFYWLDTGGELGDGVYPYAQMASTSGSGVDLLTVQGDYIIYADSGSYLWTHHRTDRVTQSTLETGRIRFRTNERKLFKFAEVFHEPLPAGCSIVVEVIDEEGTLHPVSTLDTAGSTRSGPLAIPDLGPQTHIALKFTLNGTTTTWPSLNSYLVKALPSAKPQRLITLPLLCFDREQSKSGQRYGKEGYAAERVAALQALEDVGDTITFQDFGAPTPTSTSVVIESLRFIQTGVAPPAPGFSGKGGILVVQLRTAEA